MQQLINAEELSEMLQIPVTTLYAWRLKGTGPTAIRVGRWLRYRPSDIEAWLEEQTRNTDQRPVA